MVVRDGKLVKQSDVVREAVKAGEWKKALRIAKGFRLNVSVDQRRAMCIAYECMVHPAFYKQIGVDIPKTIEEGIRIVNGLYGEERVAGRA